MPYADGDQNNCSKGLFIRHYVRVDVKHDSGKLARIDLVLIHAQRPNHVHEPWTHSPGATATLALTVRAAAAGTFLNTVTPQTLALGQE